MMVVKEPQEMSDVVKIIQCVGICLVCGLYRWLVLTLIATSLAGILSNLVYAG